MYKENTNTKHTHYGSERKISINVQIYVCGGRALPASSTRNVLYQMSISLELKTLLAQNEIDIFYHSVDVSYAIRISPLGGFLRGLDNMHSHWKAIQ